MTIEQQTPVPTAPKERLTVRKRRTISERLTHRPFQENQGLNDLLDRLNFAPRGEEYAPKKGRA